MPYDTIQDLPPAVRNALPPAAQRVFRTVANRELEKPGGNDRQAFRTAWGAVERAGWKKVTENGKTRYVKKDSNMPASTRDALQNKVKEHNEKYGDDAGKKATLSMLQAVYRRGIGAFRTNPSSVRPNVSSAEQWAMGRVNGFLAILRGSRKDTLYDQDLLPSSHPKHSKDKEKGAGPTLSSVHVPNADDKLSTTKAEESFVPPKAAQNAARQALRWKEKYGDEVKGGTQVGWTRARQLASGEALSRDIVSRMSQFARHKSNSKVDPKHKNEPWKDAGHVAWKLWGDDAGVEWAQSVMDRISKSIPASPFFGHVPHVVGMCSKPEVLDVHAQRVVALMEDMHFGRDGSVRKGPDNAAYSTLLSVDSDTGVVFASTIFADPSSPNVTSGSAFNVKSFANSIRKGEAVTTVGGTKTVPARFYSMNSCSDWLLAHAAQNRGFTKVSSGPSALHTAEPNHTVASLAGLKSLETVFTRKFNHRRSMSKRDQVVKSVEKASGARTLYASRPLLNAEAVIEHYKAQGVETLLLPDDMHVTVAYSKDPIRWEDMAYTSTWNIRIEGGARQHQILGGKAFTLCFDAPELVSDWLHFRMNGAGYDFAAFQPHVTLTYNAPAKVIEPYSGPLIFGEMQMQEVDPPETVMEKRQTGDDQFTTAEEARAASVDMGCNGDIHVHDTEDGAFYMPGATHQAYLDRKAEIAGIDPGGREDGPDDTMERALRTVVDSILGKSFNIDADIVKAEQRIVYGWASVVSVDGKPVVDKQGHVISPAEMEKMADAFMLSDRTALAMHTGETVGTVIHSMPITKSLMKSLGADTQIEGWLIAVKVKSDEVWKAIKDGTLKAFSIGGKGKLRDIPDA